MDHGLFVARQIIGEIVAALEERLAETGDIAVAEYSKAAREEAMVLVVTFDRLHSEKAPAQR